MKKIKQIAAVLFLLVFMGVSASAANADKVVDRADLLTDQEEEKLEKQFTEIADAYQCDVAVLTTNTLDGKSPMDYTDDYYEESGYGYGENLDGIILMVSMEDRDWRIETFGKAIRIFTDYGQNQIRDLFLDDLSDGNYYEAFRIFGSAAEEFMEEASADRPYDVDHEYSMPLPLWLRFAAAGIFALIVSGIVILVLRSQLRSVAPKRTARGYVKEGSFQLMQANDLFLYRTVNRRKIKQESSSGSGGSTTHKTSSGRSAGGSGGKF